MQREWTSAGIWCSSQSTGCGGANRYLRRVASVWRSIPDLERDGTEIDMNWVVSVRATFSWFEILRV